MLLVLGKRHGYMQLQELTVNIAVLIKASQAYNDQVRVGVSSLSKYLTRYV